MLLVLGIPMGDCVWYRQCNPVRLKGRHRCAALVPARAVLVFSRPLSRFEANHWFGLVYVQYPNDTIMEAYSDTMIGEMIGVLEIFTRRKRAWF
jgi:hypothetical protein